MRAALGDEAYAAGTVRGGALTVEEAVALCDELSPARRDGLTNGLSPGASFEGFSSRSARCTHSGEGPGEGRL